MNIFDKSGIIYNVIIIERSIYETIIPNHENVGGGANLSSKIFGSLAFEPLNGFTLAEILITLGIIGVVAALTMPALIQNHREKVTVTRLKKVYSVLSQAYVSASSENLDIKEWGLGKEFSTDGAQAIAEKLLPYLKLNKDCGFEKGCFPAGVVYTYLNGSGWYNLDSSGSRAYRAILSDGTLIAIESFGTYGKIFVDINGFKGPNQDGRDLFAFRLKTEGVIPFGTQTDTITPFGKNESYTAWVIYNENTDYLKCPDKLGWDKAKSCKG